MDIYNESIYGTTRSPFDVEPSWGKYTKKEGRLYVHIFNWPANDRIEIPRLINQINHIYLHNDSLISLNYAVEGQIISIDLPETSPSSINSVLVVDVVGIPEADNNVDELRVNNLNNAILIFPNPVVKGVINIRQKGAQNLEIGMYNASGLQLLKQYSQEYLSSFDITTWPAGNYIVTINDDENIFSRIISKK